MYKLHASLPCLVFSLGVCMSNVLPHPPDSPVPGILYHRRLTASGGWVRSHCALFYADSSAQCSVRPAVMACQSLTVNTRSGMNIQSRPTARDVEDERMAGEAGPLVCVSGGDVCVSVCV